MGAATKGKGPQSRVKSVTPANHEDEWQSMKNADADLVIFDTPARLSDHTIGPIELADLVIIPTKTTMKDLERVKATYDLIQKTSDRARTFIVINQTRPQAGRLDEPMKYLTTRGFAVCPYSLGYRVAFEDAMRTARLRRKSNRKAKPPLKFSRFTGTPLKALHHLTSEGVNHGKELSRTVA
jgi:cellulose biosynthesis protein BcsQ